MGFKSGTRGDRGPWPRYRDDYWRADCPTPEAGLAAVEKHPRRTIAEPREEFQAGVQDKRKQAQRMKAEGASIKEIQEALGVSWAMACRYLAAAE